MDIGSANTPVSVALLFISADAFFRTNFTSHSQEIPSTIENRNFYNSVYEKTLVVHNQKSTIPPPKTHSLMTLVCILWRAGHLCISNIS